jgi:putative transposase
VNDQPDQPDAISAWPQHHSLTVEVLRRPIESTQYTAIRYTQRLEKAGIRPSMGSVGDSFDNALAENFFSILKVERVYRTTYRTREEAELDLFRYIDGWYNPHRIQRELGWLSPDEYEEAYYTSKSSGALTEPTGAR